MGIYAGIFFAVGQYNKWKPKPAITYESKEEESFVKRYIDHVQHESHKPELLRKPFAA
jgi:hypothetical protein